MGHFLNRYAGAVAGAFSLAVLGMAGSHAYANDYDTHTPRFTISYANSSVTPSAAEAYFAGLPGGVTSPTIPSNYAYDSLIVEKARALQSNADRIFAYVYSSVQTTPAFGLSKGARGALLDKHGTAFDQAHLLVELLRAAGHTASYKYGKLTITSAATQAWLGVPNATAASAVLRDAGIPFEVSGSNYVIAHVWVEATINLPGGGTASRLYDPGYKAYEVTAPNASQTMAARLGYDSGEVYAAATSSTSSGTNTASIPFVSGFNYGAMSGKLYDHAGALLGSISANSTGGVVNGQPSSEQFTIDELLGEREIARIDPELATAVTSQQLQPVSRTATWTWTGQVPLNLRTQVTIAFDTNWTGSGAAECIKTASFTAEEIYGRTFGFVAVEDVGDNDWRAALILDGVAEEVGCQHIEDAFRRKGVDFTLTINHPYPGAKPPVGSAAAVAGSYMDDVSHHRAFLFGGGAAIVLGLGVGTEAVTQQINLYSAKNPHTRAVYQYGWSNYGGGNAIDEVHMAAISEGNGYDQAAALAASWNAQYSMMARRLEQVAGAVHTLHHSVGVISSHVYTQDDTYLRTTATTRISIESMASIYTTNNVTADRAAAKRVLAAAAHALEASVDQQQNDSLERQSVGALWATIAAEPGREFLFADSSNWATVRGHISNSSRHALTLWRSMSMRVTPWCSGTLAK